MLYNITKSPHVSGHKMLTFEPSLSADDLARASLLARSLHGQYARGFSGFIMTPANAEKWAALFDAGYSAYSRRTTYGFLEWRYTLNDGPDTCRVMAVARAREAAA